MENPLPFASRGVGVGLYKSWDAKETWDALNLRINMPGFRKEDVKASNHQR
ncbi:hypothetical protein REPUB_Repub10bG0051000 [Reevesia pubescens]